jgi:SAM-dependent methyltransferase
MSGSDLQAQITAAKAYEEFFVPALFGEWAPRVAAAVRIRTGDHVLDVACGTGVLAREAASQVGPSGFVAGVDTSAGMLAVARTVAPRIEWREDKAEALPYPDQRFDAVVSQFGLMFFSDRRRALTEMQRVLKRGGRLAVAVWASLDSSPAYAAEVDLLEHMAGSRRRRNACALRTRAYESVDAACCQRRYRQGCGCDSAWYGAVPQHPVHGRGGLARMATSHGSRPDRRSNQSHPAGSRTRASRPRHGDRDGGL